MEAPPETVAEAREQAEGEAIERQEAEALPSPPEPRVVGGALPTGYEWYANHTGGGEALGDPHVSTVMHDGSEDAATSPGLFPAGCFESPGCVWGAQGWTPTAPATGAPVQGVRGTPFEDYVFIWAADGSHGGRWARPKK